MKYKKSDMLLKEIPGNCFENRTLLLGSYQRPLCWSAVAIAKYFNALIDGLDVGVVTIHQIIDNKAIKARTLIDEEVEVFGPANQFLIVDG